MADGECCSTCHFTQQDTCAVVSSNLPTLCAVCSHGLVQAPPAPPSPKVQLEHAKRKVGWACGAGQVVLQSLLMSQTCLCEALDAWIHQVVAFSPGLGLAHVATQAREWAQETYAMAEARLARELEQRVLALVDERNKALDRWVFMIDEVYICIALGSTMPVSVSRGVGSGDEAAQGVLPWTRSYALCRLLMPKSLPTCSSCPSLPQHRSQAFRTKVAEAIAQLQAVMEELDVEEQQVWSLRGWGWNCACTRLVVPSCSAPVPGKHMHEPHLSVFVTAL